MLNIDKEMSEMFEKHGAFYAFSKSQMEEKQVKDVEYVSGQMGLICPKDNYMQLLKDFDKIHEDGVKKVLSEKTHREIIWHELGNYECQITYDYSEAFYAVKMYGITEEEVKAVWPDFIDHCNKHELY